MSTQIYYQAKKASDNITSLIGKLIEATDNGKIEWESLNSSAKSRAACALFQDKTVTKYRLTAKSDKVCSVIFSADDNKDDYNLEIEFSDKRDFLLELPLENEHKQQLRLLKSAIANQLEISSILKINSQLPDYTHFLSGL